LLSACVGTAVAAVTRIFYRFCDHQREAVGGGKAVPCYRVKCPLGRRKSPLPDRIGQERRIRFLKPFP